MRRTSEALCGRTMRQSLAEMEEHMATWRARLVRWWQDAHQRYDRPLEAPRPARAFPTVPAGSGRLTVWQRLRAFLQGRVPGGTSSTLKGPVPMRCHDRPPGVPLARGALGLCGLLVAVVAVLLLGKLVGW